MPVANVIVGNDGGNVLHGTAGADLIYGFNPDGPQGTVGSIAATRVASGLSAPLYVTSAPGDPNRLFVVEHGGLIKVLDLTTGAVLATPFLDVTNEIRFTSESGLLGLVFDPNFQSNGFFYVNLINTAGDTEIRRYHVSGDPNRADPASMTRIITVDQPSASNHKAGWLGFGPDGYLYAALGDGGADASTAQNVNSLLGKILRLDLSADAFPGDSSRFYTVPADNPFVGVAGMDEIWAMGLRNPWRDSFDRGGGDLFIADVGQSTRTAQVAPNAGAINNPSSFGEDVFGRLYIVDYDGEVFRLTPTVGSADLPDAIDGGGGNDVIFGGSGSDTLGGGSGHDILHGGPGGELITGGSGNDFIDGGSGTDTAAFSGARARYAVTFLPGQTIRVTDTAGGSPDGTDTAAGVEYLQFSDGTFSLAQVNRMPTGIAVAGGALVAAEGVANGTVIATLAGLDPDGSIAGYTLLDSAAGRFALDNLGRVSIADTARIDFEAATGHRITVRATDNMGAAVERHFTVGVEDRADVAPFELVSERADRADGTFVTTHRDGADSFTWASYSDDFTPAGERLIQRVLNDGGDLHNQFWDVSNQFAWSTVVDDFDALSQRTGQRIFQDAGNFTGIYFDPNNAETWSSVVDYFDAGARRIQQSVALDAGGGHNQYFDVANQQNWSSVVDYFNGSGFRFEQRIFYDDGTSQTVMF
jgi:hypothetical protein